MSCWVLACPYSTKQVCGHAIDAWLGQELAPARAGVDAHACGVASEASQALARAAGQAVLRTEHVLAALGTFKSPEHILGSVEVCWASTLLHALGACRRPSPYGARNARTVSIVHVGPANALIGRNRAFLKGDAPYQTLVTTLPPLLTLPMPDRAQLAAAVARRPRLRPCDASTVGLAWLTVGYRVRIKVPALYAVPHTRVRRRIS